MGVDGWSAPSQCIHAHPELLIIYEFPQPFPSMSDTSDARNPFLAVLIPLNRSC